MSARQGVRESNAAYRCRLDPWRVPPVAEFAPSVVTKGFKMQNSGTFPGLSDGVKKTIVGKTPPKPAKAKPPKKGK